MSNGPIEPSADIRAFAKAMHGLYVALGQEGFDEQQALSIVGQFIAANGSRE